MLKYLQLFLAMIECYGFRQALKQWKSQTDILGQFSTGLDHFVGFTDTKEMCKISPASTTHQYSTKNIVKQFTAHVINDQDVKTCKYTGVVHELPGEQVLSLMDCLPHLSTRPTAICCSGNLSNQHTTGKHEQTHQTKANHWCEAANDLKVCSDWCSVSS